MIRNAWGSPVLNPDGDINLHTHTCYCDGKDDPEDMVRTAVEKGFRVLGFSGHGYCEVDIDCCMSEAGEREYRDRILALREKYRGKIDIRLGMERDYYNENTGYPYDYEIGSVHYVQAGGEYLAVDDTAEIAAGGVNRLFGGNWRAYVECYYETAADVLRKTGADIVGHFDLVTKFNEGNRWFDEDADWYRAAALHSLRKLAETRVCPRSGMRDILGAGPRAVFEVNTGGMAKKYRSRPYPAPFLQEALGELGCSVIYSSDCHDRTKLDFGFRELLPLKR